MSHSTISSSRMQELLAKIRAQKSISQSSQIGEAGDPTIPKSSNLSNSSNSSSNSSTSQESNPLEITDKYGNLITLNSKQSEFVSLASSARSCVLIGAAGTGKTTCQKAVVQSMIQKGILGLLDAQGHKINLSIFPNWRSR